MKPKTPMMQQYYALKKQHMDKFLFFRLGDFYELFESDARKASTILSILLTKRNGIDMCGIPHHQFNNYAHKIIKQGEKIAIAEQVGDLTSGEKIIERKVTKVISPGMVLDDNLLPQTNNYLLILSFVNLNGREVAKILIIDISVGEVLESEIEISSFEIFLDEVKDILYHYSPKEMIVEEMVVEKNKLVDLALKKIKGIKPELILTEVKNDPVIKNFSKEEIAAVLKKIFFSFSFDRYHEPHYNLLAKFILANGFADSLYFKEPVSLKDNDYMVLDHTALKQLEIVENQFSELKEFTLFNTMDCTLTLMGKRWLRKNLIKPLKHFSKIESRVEKVSKLKSSLSFLNSVRDKLKSVHDLERIIINIQNNTVAPKGLLKLSQSLGIIIDLVQDVEKALGSAWELVDLNQVLNNLEKVREIHLLIKKNILEEASSNLKDGNVINPASDSALNELFLFKKNSLNLLNQLEKKAQGLTGLPALKIKYNSNQRFFFEVSKLHSHKVKEGFIKKQTLTNCDRFVNSELLELDNKLLNLKEEILLREKNLYQGILNSIKAELGMIIKISDFITELDFYSSLAYLANKHGLSKPSFNQEKKLNIENARHLVVEHSLASGDFIPNSLSMDDQNFFHLITGPNMSGKSTFLRQNALLFIMAQTGSYVPATKADLPVIDKIFTRIGSGDKLSQGESTFMVEMKEVAEIIKKSTDNSFVIMDEIGRGTGKDDGYVLAESIIEHFLKLKKTKTLFASHYHELGNLSKTYKQISNYTVLVKESDNEVFFLKKVVAGIASKSYGLYVAELAGLPAQLLSEAKKKLEAMEEKPAGDREISKGREYSQKYSQDYSQGHSLWAADEAERKKEEPPYQQIYEEIRNIDLNQMTPLEALNYLSRLIDKLKKKHPHA